MGKNIKSYLKGVGSGYAKTALTILVGLWMVPFTLKYLTLAEYGMFAIAGDILLLLGLLQLGTGSTLGSRAAQMIGKRDTEHLSGLTSTALVLQIIAAVLTVIIGGVISLTMDTWFRVDEPVDGLRIAVFVLVLGASIRITAQVFSALLIANKQNHVDNLLGIGMFLFRTSLTVVFLIGGMKIMALAWSALISTIVISCIAYWRVRKQMPEVEISVKNFSSVHVRDLLGNGIWFTIGGLAGILIVNLDRFMVGRYVSLEAVAAYIITGKLYFIAEKVFGQIFQIMRPYFGQLHGQGKTKRLHELYNAAFSSSLCLSVLMASIVFLINKWFITWWVGPGFYLGETVSFLFALNFVLQSSVLPNRILLASTLFKMPQQNIARVSEGFLNLGLTIAFVQLWGISGVLVGSVVASCLGSTIFVNLIARSFFSSMEGANRSLWGYFAVASLVLIYWGAEFGLYAYLLALLVYILVTALLLGGRVRKYYHQFKAHRIRS